MPSKTTMRDEELFARMKHEAEEAFKEIYERFFDDLYIHARTRLQNKEEARDVVQEVFATLWDKRDTISLNGSLAAYLYTAVRNRIFNIFAHKQVETAYIQSFQHFLDNCVSQTDHLARTNQLNSVIEKEVACLPSKMQRVFELSRKSYLSHKEIATELDLSEHTVKKQVSNALRILRLKLGAEGNQSGA